LATAGAHRPGSDQPEGKILRLTLDGKPAPAISFGETGAATIPLIDPPKDTNAKTAGGENYAFRPSGAG
jgi:hypothetical protein